MAPLPMGVPRRTDSWREWCLWTAEPPGPPGFVLSIHRPGLPPSYLGRPQRLLGLYSLTCKMGRQVAWGRKVLDNRDILALLAVTGRLAWPASPCRWTPTGSVMTAGSAHPFLHSPTPRLPDSWGESPASHHFLQSYLRTLTLDLLPCVSQGEGV